MSEGSLYIDRGLLEIATSVPLERPGLRRVMLDPERQMAAATDSYRILTQPVPGGLLASLPAPVYVDGDALVPYLKDRAGMPKFEALLERAFPSDLSFPSWSQLLDRPFIGKARVSWDGDGGSRHGAGWAGWEVALEHWGYFDGDRRKPVGMVRLEVAEDGRFSYRLGMRTETKETKSKYSPAKSKVFFSAFEDHAREAAGVLSGPLVEVVSTDGEGRLGTYAASYLRSMWTRGVDEVGLVKMSLSLPMDCQPLWFHHVSGAVGMLMPIRM